METFEEEFWNKVPRPHWWPSIGKQLIGYPLLQDRNALNLLYRRVMHSGYGTLRGQSRPEMRAIACR